MGALFFSKGETTTPPHCPSRGRHAVLTAPLTSLSLTMAGRLAPKMLSRLRVLMDSAALGNLALILMALPKKKKNGCRTVQSEM